MLVNCTDVICQRESAQDQNDMDRLCVALQLGSLILLICRPGDCYSIRCSGELTLDQEVIVVGSNVTVHCRSDTSECGRLFVIELDKHEVLHKISCSTVTAQFMVSQPRSSLKCKVQLNGKFYVVCGRDIEAEFIPNPPQIMEIAFTKDSPALSIDWQTSDHMELLQPDLRFRITHAALDWMKANVTQPQRGKLLMLETLEPWTSYEFKLRVCTITLKHNCSLWSQPVSKTTPRKAPSSKLDVWRIIKRHEENPTQNVTVMWKAFISKAHEGELWWYELVYRQNGTINTLNLSRAVTQHSLQLSLEVTELNVSAVTSAGSSPPASLSLTYTGRPAPMIYLSKPAEGRIPLAWSASPPSHTNTSEEMLGFVVQWQCSPLKVQWKKIRRDQNSTFIEGPPSCTHYNISLYVESSEGVSDPTFGQEGTTLPEMMSTSRFASTEHKGHTDGMVIGISLMTAVPLIIIVNLIYLKCTKQRIRKECISMGPSWLFGQLPKLEDSNAIKLLKDESCGSDVCWHHVDCDPPLSPIERFSPAVERKDSYPTTHTEGPLEEMKAVQNFAVCPYKPQVIFPSQKLEPEPVEKEENDHPWVFSSPAITKFDEMFSPNQGICRPLNSCLTVDGAPVSLDAKGFFFFHQTSLEENTWRVQGDETFGDENPDQSQVVLPNDLIGV
ncbi:interleukin-23 receptor isoform X2 [Brachyhypopomus gauderio]|uniref:interleukin-23 receptor isoform X2 n=1 Tax=Brachyhypopomus gauderio TaxID=698409 RepID=UPI004041776C